MSRAARMRHKANRLEISAIQASIRATGSGKPFGWKAIRAGQIASKKFRQSDTLFAAADEVEQASAREKASKKLPRKWWKQGKV